ncbi:MAG: hypothetical protein ACK58L_14505 [Planctomycetota bacterium]
MRLPLASLERSPGQTFVKPVELVKPNSSKPADRATHDENCETAKFLRSGL